MIIEPTIEDGIKSLHSENEYVFCTYDDSKEILIYKDEFVEGVTSTISNIFGADTVENMDAEIVKRNLTQTT